MYAVCCTAGWQAMTPLHAARAPRPSAAKRRPNAHLLQARSVVCGMSSPCRTLEDETEQQPMLRRYVVRRSPLEGVAQPQRREIDVQPRQGPGAPVYVLLVYHRPGDQARKLGTG